MKIARLPLAAAALWLAGALAAPALAASHPDFGGIWEHSSTSRPRSGPPPWTDKAKQLLAQDQKEHWHDGVSEENTYCLPAGMPFMMTGSEGFDVAYNKNELVVINEERPSPRHIYWDGRKHENMEVFDRTTVGNSIAHWEGETLVVDTIGFLAGATVQFVRSEKTHLVEHWNLMDGGKRLHIVFTWTDPDLLTKPWTYEYFMERAPADRVAMEYYCDPRDPARHTY